MYSTQVANLVAVESDAAWDADVGLSAYHGIDPSGGGYPLPHVLPLSLSQQQQLGYSVTLGAGYTQPSFTMAADKPPSMMYGQPLAMQSASVYVPTNGSTIILLRLSTATTTTTVAVTTAAATTIAVANATTNGLLLVTALAKPPDTDPM